MTGESFNSVLCNRYRREILEFQLTMAGVKHDRQTANELNVASAFKCLLSGMGKMRWAGS